MTQLSGYGAYKLFLALRTHFNNEKYDFIKFGGQVSATKDAFNARKDRQIFEKLSKRYDLEELRDLYIANFIEGEHYAIRFLDQEASDKFFEYRSRKQSMCYVFGNELDKVFSRGIARSTKCEKGMYPYILELYMGHEICLETMVILDDLVPFIDRFDKHLGGDTVWSVIKMSILKMRPFVKYDKEKAKSVLKEKINDRQGQESEEVSTEEPTYR